MSSNPQPMLLRIKSPLQKHKVHFAWLMALISILTIGIIDSLTSPELALSPFYLIPIIVITYYAGLREGMSISLASIIVYVGADWFFTVSYADSAIPYWNAGVRLVLFVSVTYFVAKRKELEIERKTAENAVRIFAELHAIDRAIISARSSEEIVREALQRAKELIPYEAASVVRFDFEQGRCSFVCVVSPNGQYSAPAQIFLETIDLQILTCLKEGSMNQAGVQNSSPLLCNGLLPFEGIKSGFFVPLRSQDDLIGALSMGSQTATRFSSEHLEIAREIANQMAVALQNAHLYEELQAAHQRLQMLNHRLINAQETERHHLARELHDELGQALTVLRIQLDEIDLFDVSHTPSERLKESTAMIERILDQVRNLSLDLRPLVLDDLGLAAALRWYVSRKSQISGFVVHFQSEFENIPLSEEVETACFRVAQEAITNILRHSRAKHVSLDLSRRNGQILLAIRDDGVGFDVERAYARSLKGESLGLLGMKERISLLGGNLEIESVPSCGTEVRVRVPVPLETQTELQKVKI